MLSFVDKLTKKITNKITKNPPSHKATAGKGGMKMAEENEDEKEAWVYLFDGSIVRGKIVSPDIQVRKGLITTIVIKTSDLKEVKKSTFGFSRKNAAVKLIDGSVFKGSLLGSIK